MKEFVKVPLCIICLIIMTRIHTYIHVLCKKKQKEGLGISSRPASFFFSPDVCLCVLEIPHQVYIDVFSNFTDEKWKPYCFTQVKQEEFLENPFIGLLPKRTDFLFLIPAFFSPLFERLVRFEWVIRQVVGTLGLIIGLVRSHSLTNASMSCCFLRVFGRLYFVCFFFLSD